MCLSIGEQEGSVSKSKKFVLDSGEWDLLYSRMSIVEKSLRGFFIVGIVGKSERKLTWGDYGLLGEEQTVNVRGWKNVTRTQKYVADLIKILYLPYLVYVL